MNKINITPEEAKEFFSLLKPEELHLMWKLMKDGKSYDTTSIMPVYEEIKIASTKALEFNGYTVVNDDKAAAKALVCKLKRLTEKEIEFIYSLSKDRLNTLDIIAQDKYQKELIYEDYEATNILIAETSKLLLTSDKEANESLNITEPEIDNFVNKFSIHELQVLWNMVSRTTSIDTKYLIDKISEVLNKKIREACDSGFVLLVAADEVAERDFNERLSSLTLKELKLIKVILENQKLIGNPFIEYDSSYLEIEERRNERILANTDKQIKRKEESKQVIKLTRKSN